MSRKFVLLLLPVCMLICMSACDTTNTSADSTNIPSKSQSEYINTTDQFTHTHSYTAATCTLPKTCSCGVTAGSALGHQFSPATCTSPEICTRCGITNGNILGHSYSDATCVAPQICQKCSAVSGSALGHSYVNYICSRCGVQDPESLPVSLHLLPVVDATYECKYHDQILKDNFGNSYVGYHSFKEEGNNPGTAIYYLNGEYAHFSCDVLTLCDAGQEVSFVIYVDDQIVFKSDRFDRIDGKIHVDIDVKNGQQLKISSWNHAGSWGDTIYVVNAQAFKK